MLKQLDIYKGFASSLISLEIFCSIDSEYLLESIYQAPVLKYKKMGFTIEMFVFCKIIELTLTLEIIPIFRNRNVIFNSNFV